VAIELELDSVESLSEPVKQLYVKDDASGKFRFSPDLAANSVAALVTKRDQLLGEKHKFKDLSTVLGEHNLTADELKTLIQSRDKAAEDDAKKAGNFEQLKKSLVDGYEG